MKVLLTGGAGYIGSHTAVALTEQGHEVVLLDNLSNSTYAVVESLEKITGRKYPFVELDIRNTFLIEKILTEYNIEAVIHFAGLKAVGDSVKSPLSYYDNNVHGSISLLQAMANTGVNTLVFSSSATVYGPPEYLPYDESHKTAATNPYGNTKLQIEDMLRDLASSNGSWRIICLRYFNPAGAHPSGLIGESPIGPPNNIMPYVAQVASGIRTHLNVFGNDYPTPDGTGMRDYIHVSDLADAHIEALKFLGSQAGWHMFNIGTGVPNSVLELVRTFEYCNNVKVPYQFVPRRLGDLASYYANPAKANKHLGWRARFNLSDMCISTWNYQKNQNKGNDK